MKKVFAICLFVLVCAKVQGQIIVNADGTHSIQHGSHIINPNGTISVQHGSVIVNTNGGHSTIQGLPGKDDSKDLPNHSLELLSNKQQKNQQLYFKSRMAGAAARLDKVDTERKARKQEKQLKKKRLRHK